MSNNYSHNNPFKVPDGFFKMQRAELISVTSKQYKIHQKRKVTFKIMLRSITAAASLTAIGVLTSVMLDNAGDKCASYTCLLESTNFNNLSESELDLLEAWEEELIDEEYEML